MAQGDQIPDEHHITRIVGPSKVDSFDDGPYVNPSVFLPREGEYLSVNWVEFARGGSYEDCLTAVRQACENNTKMTVRDSSLLPIVNVGKMRAAAKENARDPRNLTVTHEPEPNDPSHSAIHGYNHEDALTAKSISDCVEKIEKVRPNA